MIFYFSEVFKITMYVRECARSILCSDKSNRINVNFKHMKSNVILPMAEETYHISNCVCQNTIY